MTKKVLHADDVQFRTQLKEAGYRVTPARLALLHVLESSGKPLSVQRIIEQLQEVDVDQATVYRTLNAFHESGIVRSVDFQHGHAHYELSSGPHHHHVVCKECGRVEDIESCGIQEISRRVLQSSRFSEIHEHSLEFFGVCSACSKAAQSVQ